MPGPRLCLRPARRHAPLPGHPGWRMPSPEQRPWARPACPWLVSSSPAPVTLRLVLMLRTLCSRAPPPQGRPDHTLLRSSSPRSPHPLYPALISHDLSTPLPPGPGSSRALFTTVPQLPQQRPAIMGMSQPNAGGVLPASPVSTHRLRGGRCPGLLLAMRRERLAPADSHGAEALPPPHVTHSPRSLSSPGVTSAKTFPCFQGTGPWQSAAGLSQAGPSFRVLLLHFTCVSLPLEGGTETTASQRAWVNFTYEPNPHAHSRR